jgi:hypothetical protein
MLNKVMLIGYVGADSEMKFTPGGIPVANFSLAVKETYKNGGGEKKTNTLWIRCVAWRRWAEIAGEFVGKGKFLSKAFDKNFPRVTCSPTISAQRRQATQRIQRVLVFFSPSPFL